MFNVIGAIFSGLVIGALARFLYPGPVQMGWLMTIILGLGGSLVAGLITASRARGGLRGGYQRAGCLASVVGAMALIFLGHTLGWR
jgi:uncharacterized membrane protein YeaQ/YmgE (transglycosylase-associated protein family)